MNHGDLLSILACPACGGALAEAAGASLACGACSRGFPRVGRVPWLYRDAAAKLAEWRNLVDVGLEEQRRHEDRLKAAVRVPELGALARQRLHRDLQARVEHRKALEVLLAPFLGEQAATAVDLTRVLAGKAAGTQKLASYAVNALRDWGWSETEENRLALDLCWEALPPAARGPGCHAVLGAGAGRLAYDLHERRGAGATVTLDINPFLTLVAERITAGKNLVLQEFPLAPDGLESVAVARKLAAPAKARAGWSVLFGDVLDAPFAAGAFDAVVTPWLVDILPEAPAVFLRRLNRLLKPGGTWLYHGSCVFEPGPVEAHLSREEFLALLPAAGFGLNQPKLARLPYLSSPASCQGRTELVLTFAAVKTRDVPAPAAFSPLPPWLADRARPLPRPEGLLHLGVMHAFHAEVLGLVDGQRSAADLGALLAAKYRLDRESLTATIVAFLAAMYEQAGARP